MTKKEWNKFIENVVKHNKLQVKHLYFEDYDEMKSDLIYSYHCVYGKPYVNMFNKVIDPCTYPKEFESEDFTFIDTDTLKIKGCLETYIPHEISIDGETYHGYRTVFEPKEIIVNRKYIRRIYKQ